MSAISACPRRRALIAAVSSIRLLVVCASLLTIRARDCRIAECKPNLLDLDSRCTISPWLFGPSSFPFRSFPVHLVHTNFFTSGMPCTHCAFYQINPQQAACPSQKCRVWRLRAFHSSHIACQSSRLASQ